jgi:hypothetical protein
MHTEKIESVKGDLVIFPTVVGRGPVPCGAFLYDQNGQQIARVVAEPERLTGDAGVSRVRYKIEPAGALKTGSFVWFE